MDYAEEREWESEHLRGPRTDDRDMPSHTSEASTTDTAGTKIDRQVKRRVGVTLFNLPQIVAFVHCCYCEKPRCVYSVNSSESDRAALDTYIEHVPWSCGEALIRHDTPLARTHFVKQGI
eukprot:COSAG01_NODE_31500_length_596_cov_1.173038_1_plen_119_part_10